MKTRHFKHARESGAKKYFLDHHTHNTMRGFRDSLPVRNIYGCYSRISKKFKEYLNFIQAMQAIKISR